MMIRDKDTKYTKLFVGGIPYSSNDDALRNFFGEFGEIVEAVVIKDRITNKSKGYGFVTMATSDAAALACKNKRPFIEGRQANVNLAYLGAKPKPAKSQGKLTINPNYSFQQACSVSSAPQYVYAPLYSPSQAPSQGSMSPLSVIPPQSPTGPLPQSLAAFQQPYLVDYGNGTMVLVNTVYDPGFYYQTPYVPSPTANNNVGHTFTFPPGPATPPLSAPINGQAFFPTTAFDMGAIQQQVQCQ